MKNAILIFLAMLSLQNFCRLASKPIAILMDITVAWNASGEIQLDIGSPDMVGSQKTDRLELVPITLDEANAFVEKWHRHHKPVPGAKFCIAVSCNGNICGVAIVGRPCARMLQDGWTLEVRRTCTDGTRNANSMLYGAARRAAWALGYKKLITYTLPEEGGASLAGAGFKNMGKAGGGPWNRPSRPSVDTHPLQIKIKWEVDFQKELK